MLVSGCDQTPNKGSADNRTTVLVFCGITMIDPVIELAELFEKEQNVDVKMTYGGSQDLSKSIEVNKLGDIFFPGFKSFVERMDEQGHIVDSALVGHNELSFFVAKGNPLQLTGDLFQLTNPMYNVVIGHEDLGSVGKETKHMLTKLGIYDQVVKNAVFMASDSKGLTAAIRDEKADLVLNWKAVAKHKDNDNHVDVISIPDSNKKPLVMASLKYSANPELAASFLKLCASEKGRKIFEKHGF